MTADTVIDIRTLTHPDFRAIFDRYLAHIFRSNPECAVFKLFFKSLTIAGLFRPHVFPLVGVLKVAYNIVETIRYVDRVGNLIYKIGDRKYILDRSAKNCIGHIWYFFYVHKAFRRFRYVPAFFLAERVAEAQVPRRLLRPARVHCRVIRLY